MTFVHLQQVEVTWQCHGLHDHVRRLGHRVGPQTRRKIRLPFVPPKPNELLRTLSILMALAVFGT
jgi:hypothetical protein